MINKLPPLEQRQVIKELIDKLYNDIAKALSLPDSWINTQETMQQLKHSMNANIEDI